MSRIEQQLVDIGYQIEHLKLDLARSREQFESIDEMAQDANLRAIVSETPEQAKNAQEMMAAREKLEAVINSMVKEVNQLMDRRDLLLEKLFEENNN